MKSKEKENSASLGKHKHPTKQDYLEEVLRN